MATAAEFLVHYSLNSPQRERLPCFKSGISVVKKIKPAVVTGAGERLAFSESQGVERPEVFLEFNLNEYSVLVALLIDSKDFCRNGSHLWHFLRLTSPEMAPAFQGFRTERHQRRRESPKDSHLSPKKSSLFENLSMALGVDRSTILACDMQPNGVLELSSR